MTYRKVSSGILLFNEIDSDQRRLMKLRILVLPFAAVVIAALVQWRYSREEDSPPQSFDESALQLAPRFELYDQQSQLVKFERYLGRTEMLVVFVDGTVPADANPLLIRLRDQSSELSDSGLQVVVVTLATPHAIRESERRAGVEFPFPVLTDIDRHRPIPAPVHRLWGMADEESATTRAGAFFVNRSGRVATKEGMPSPLADVDMFLDEHLSSK